VYNGLWIHDDYDDNQRFELVNRLTKYKHSITAHTVYIDLYLEILFQERKVFFSE